MNSKKQITLLLGIFLSMALYSQESIKIEAESLNSKSEKISISKKKTGETTIGGGFASKGWIKFDDVDFGEGKGQLKIRAASGSKSKKASLEVRLNSPDGELIGKIKVPVKGWDSFNEADAVLARKISSTADICIVSTSGGVILDWIEFTKYN